MKFKRLYAFAVAISIWIANFMLISAADNLPETVRIGLYYGSSGASVFNVSAEKGLEFGFVRDGKFNIFAQNASNSLITVRKDTYYTREKNKFTEYKPGTSTNKPGVETFGPYHIQINGNYNEDFTLVNKTISELKQKGINGYPVYTDKWEVWVGYYTSEKDAQNDIAATIVKNLGQGDYKVIQPALQHIVVMDSEGNTQFLYANKTAAFQIHPKDENNPYLLKLDNSRFRGDLEIKRFSDSDMTVINIVPVERYLYGVVPYEIESYSNPEALKAQAVVARTYTLNNRGKYSKWAYDMDNTTRCQVYKGYDGEVASTNKAVDDTRGKLVMYKGNRAQVFYYASSGGWTEDVENVWGSKIPYLVSVEDKYEPKDLANSNWTASVSVDKIKELTKGTLGDIVGLTVKKYSSTGRVVELVVTGTKGEKTYLREDTRYLFSLRSQMYSITCDADVYVRSSSSESSKTQLGNKKVMTLKGLKTLTPGKRKMTIVGANGVKRQVELVPTQFNFTGKGWGHGVGMSQEGAKGMAKAGFKYDQILEHYFPGTNIQ